jgi:hypothetical protein
MAEEADFLFWAGTSGEQRLQAIWELAVEAYGDSDETSRRLRGSPGGIRKR